LSEQPLNVKLGFVVDKPSQDLAKKSLKDIGREIDALGPRIDRLIEKNKKNNRTAEEYTKELQKSVTEANRLQLIGTRLTIAGAAVLAPMLLASKAYINAIGEGEKVSMRYIEAQERLKDVQIRIGRETSEILVPLMEKAADLAEQLADLLEKNPDLLKGALGLGAGLLAAGGITSLIAQTNKMIASAKLLSIGGAAGTAAGGGIMATLTPLLPAIVAATVAYIGLSKFGIKGQDESVLSSAKTAAERLGMLFMGGLDELIYGKDQANANFIERLNKSESGTTKKTVAPAGFTEAQLGGYLDFSKQNMQAQIDYHKKRTEIINSFNTSMLAMERDFQASRKSYIADFYANEKKMQVDYYYDRKKIAADYNVDIQRMEEDHQQNIRKITESHADRMEDLISKRDALGIVREMRDFGRQRRDADEEYRQEASRKNQDFARRLADLALQFNIERQRRLEQFQIDLKEADEQHLARQQKAREAHRKELQDLDAKYRDEINRRRTAFIQMLEDTAAALTAERILKQKFTAAMLADLKSMMAQAGLSTTGTPPSREFGGYVGAGAYMMHANEFVMTAQTTRAAEQLASGKINQASLLRMLSGGGVVYNDHRKIDGRLLPEDRRAMQRDTQELLKGLFA